MAVTLVQATRLKWCVGLAQLEGRPKETIHQWLASATYAPSIAGKALLLSGVNNRFVLGALGMDINRTASAASETLRNIVEIGDIPKSIAWPHVKLYYAALFYAHVLLRVWGRSPSYFRTLEMIHLRNTLAAYSVVAPFNVVTGQYLVSANLGASTVELRADNGGGGSHEVLWREFYQSLGDLRGILSASGYLEADKRRLDQEIATLISLISDSGASVSWLSQMRNDIHYRQAEGVWYPYQGKTKASSIQQEVRVLLTGSADFSKLVSVTGSSLVRFRAACLAVVCLARAVLDDMEKIGGAKSFLKHGQRRFEDGIAAVV